MMLKQALNAMTKVAATPRMNMAAPKRYYMLCNKNMVSMSLLRPSMMTFATTQTGQATAAETPASHMHRTMALDRSITSFFEKQTGQ